MNKYTKPLKFINNRENKIEVCKYTYNKKYGGINVRMLVDYKYYKDVIKYLRNKSYKKYKNKKGVR